MNWQRIREMYVFEGLSTAAIAKHFGRSKRTINKALRSMGVELRTKTSRRICKIPGCGRECFKMRCHNGTAYVLSGGLCHEHQIETWRRKNVARRMKQMYSSPQEHKVREAELHKPIGFALE